MFQKIIKLQKNKIYFFFKNWVINIYILYYHKKKMSQTQIFIVQVSGGKEIIKFAKKFNPNESLSNIRKELGEKIPQNVIFIFSDDSIIDENDENKFTLEEVVDGKILHMKFIEDKNTISIDIYINDEFMEKRKLLKTEKLINIRNSLNDLISKDAIFLSKEKAEMLKNDENEFFLTDIYRLK